MGLGYGEVWGIKCSKLDHIPNLPRWINTLNLTVFWLINGYIPYLMV